MSSSSLNHWPPPHSDSALAVLISGGLDSAILLAEALQSYAAVYPITVRVGSAWEEAERTHLCRFLRAVAAPNLMPLTVLSQPVADLYGDHWSLTGTGVPALDTPDEASYLPGRNVLLLAKPLLWCAMHGVPALATAPLASNPFPDATPEFYDGMAALLGRAVSVPVRILRPYLELSLHKADVLRRGAGLPLQHTFSCIAPVRGRHCGACSKCGERRDGFRDAGLPDPTIYVSDAKDDR